MVERFRAEPEPVKSGGSPVDLAGRRLGNAEVQARSATALPKSGLAWRAMIACSGVTDSIVTPSSLRELSARRATIGCSRASMATEPDGAVTVSERVAPPVALDRL